MLVDLTPDNYIENVTTEGPLHVIMHYGEGCGPCAVTMPNYIAVTVHFEDYKVYNVKFYRFHQWDATYKEFIEKNKLQTSGVPTFRFYYMGEIINEQTRSFNDANELKASIMEVVTGIEKTMGSFDLYAS